MQFKYRKCSCNLLFQPVNFIDNRVKGYCSTECKNKAEVNAYDICIKTLETIYKRP
jgi:hypothetical protein